MEIKIPDDKLKKVVLHAVSKSVQSLDIDKIVSKVIIDKFLFHSDSTIYVDVVNFPIDQESHVAGTYLPHPIFYNEPEKLAKILDLCKIKHKQLDRYDHPSLMNGDGIIYFKKPIPAIELMTSIKWTETPETKNDYHAVKISREGLRCLVLSELSFSEVYAPHKDFVEKEEIEDWQVINKQRHENIETFISFLESQQENIAGSRARKSYYDGDKKYFRAASMIYTHPIKKKK